MRGKRLSAQERKEKLESDIDLRKRTFNNLKKHVEQGFSLDCFPEMSYKDIDYYLKTHPNEFSKEELQESIRSAKIYWEDIGRGQANGTCLGNSRSWYYNMVNRYGWRERVEVEAEHKGSVNVNIVSYASKEAPTVNPEAT